MPQDPASFRDPAGHVHRRDGRLFRTILPPGADHYRAVRATGFAARASDAGQLIAATEVDPAILGTEAPEAVFVLEHPRLDFISYPYEWSFDALRDAALLTLDLHLSALEHGITLSDASAFNIQFVGPRPLFIDYLSLIPYTPGQVWLGYRQFCRHFLNPLLLAARTGVPFQPMYRGTLDGIGARELSALLPLRAKLHPLVALHVVMQARLERTISDRDTNIVRAAQLPLVALKRNLSSLRSWMAGLAPPAAQRSPWQDYERTAHYTAPERAAKEQFVAEVVAAARPGVVWDVGCNAGQYAEVALRAGARTVIGFEPDQGALNAAYRRARDKALSLLPLCLDVANPSPALGWREQERSGLSQRRNADLVMGLAVAHHLILAADIPVTQFLDWFTGLAPAGVVEFVPKQDPMARQLLAIKPDNHPAYTAESFAALLGRHARIERRQVVTASGRELFAFSRP